MKKDCSHRKTFFYALTISKQTPWTWERLNYKRNSRVPCSLWGISIWFGDVLNLKNASIFATFQNFHTSLSNCNGLKVVSDDSMLSLSENADVNWTTLIRCTDDSLVQFNHTANSKCGASPASLLHFLLPFGYASFTDR